MDNKQRFVTIDLLRGFAMLIVILTHTTVYFLATPGVATLWNYIHFAVPIFVFCSGYVLLQKDLTISSIQDYWVFLKRRAIRLLKPYYIFLIFLFILEIIQHRFNLDHIWKGILVLVPDISWLVLLFLELTVLLPFIKWLFNHKTALYAWLMLAISSLIVFIFWHPAIDYRIYMVIPWTLPFILGYFYKGIEKNIMLRVLVTFGLGILFYALNILFNVLDKDMLLQHNKYPPNIFYFSYGFFWLFLLTLIFDIPVVQRSLKNVLTFFSLYSFQLFFIHYLLIAILFYQHIFAFNVLTFTTIIFFGSVGIQLGINKIKIQTTKSKLQ